MVSLVQGPELDGGFAWAPGLSPQQDGDCKHRSEGGRQQGRPNVATDRCGGPEDTQGFLAGIPHGLRCYAVAFH